MTLSLLALAITSLIGNTSALSRLFYAMAKDRLLPESFYKLNDRGAPARAVLAVVAVSCLMPLLGRTAIGWIVDVTTIGATLIYGNVSAAAARLGRNMKDRREMWIGRAGLGIMIAFCAYILLPNLVARGTIARETYFLLILWSVLGFLYFRRILRRDKEKRFGMSGIVRVSLLALVLFISLIWMRQSMIASNDRMLTNIDAYYEQRDDAGAPQSDDEAYVRAQVAALQKTNTRTMLMAIGLFGFTLVIMLTNHSYMTRRSRENEMLANRDPLTGVKSKHAFLVAEKALDRDIAEGVAGEFAVVVCDVNGLKNFNDTYGHKAGDEYIRKACKMVCDVYKHSPVYRVGGDEFVVIVRGREYPIHRELTRTLHDRSVDAINAGGAVSRDDAGEAAKPVGPFPDEQIILNVVKKVLIVEDEPVNQMMLGAALQEEYEVLYASDGAEALEIVKADMDNLSLMLLDLQMPGMNGREVLRIMKEDPGYSKLPVIVLTADQTAEVDCLRLGAMDFRIAMDDFGTGYSSLGMLSNLPIDALKLDMSFVSSAFGEDRDTRMIELIIEIADYLRVPVVAEGVETEEQYRALRKMGCDFIQGYYFSVPVPPEEFERFLAEKGK
ncbi:MAG: amino acid permease [Clostridia bacterium]|nr:amino acid permease [Clostridia bacterium]